MEGEKVSPLESTGQMEMSCMNVTSMDVTPVMTTK